MPARSLAEPQQRLRSVSSAACAHLRALKARRPSASTPAQAGSGPTWGGRGSGAGGRSGMVSPVSPVSPCSPRSPGSPLSPAGAGSGRGAPSVWGSGSGDPPRRAETNTAAAVAASSRASNTHHSLRRACGVSVSVSGSKPESVPVSGSVWAGVSSVAWGRGEVAAAGPATRAGETCESAGPSSRRCGGRANASTGPGEAVGGSSSVFAG